MKPGKITDTYLKHVSSMNKSTAKLPIQDEPQHSNTSNLREHVTSKDSTEDKDNIISTESEQIQQLQQEKEPKLKITLQDLLDDKTGKANLASLPELLQSYPNNIDIDIELPRIDLIDTDIAFVADIIKSNNNITSINLSGNNITDKGVQELTEAITGNEKTHLQQLNLSKNQISAIGAESLSKMLIVNKSINSLLLYGNMLGDIGVKHISLALFSNTALRFLHLGSNTIGDLGGFCIAQPLMHNSTLEFLNLSNNNAGDQCATKIAEVLANNKKSGLLKLILENNDISDEGGIKIANALVGNKTLCELHLNGNLLTNTGALAFAASLDSNCTLAALWLANRASHDSNQRERKEVGMVENKKYTDEVAVKFAEVLTRNKTLCLLDLSFSDISDTGGKEFLQFTKSDDRTVPIINRNTTIMHLYLYRHDRASQLETDVWNATALNTHRFWKLCHNIRNGEIAVQDAKEIEAFTPALRRNGKYHDVLKIVSDSKKDHSSSKNVQSASVNILLKGASLLALNIGILALSSSYLAIPSLVIIDLVVGYKINVLPQSLHSVIDQTLSFRTKFADYIASNPSGKVKEL